MARGWRVLDATSFEGGISGARGRIVFDSERGERREAPAEETAVLMIGARTSIDWSALHYLTKHDIAVVACDWRGVPFAGVMPWSKHTRVGARQLAQASLSKPRRKNAWMQIVRAKIAGQAAVLRRVAERDATHLDELVKAVRSGDPDNVEGTAARFYWSHMFGGGGKFVRDQDGGDPVNAMLNYGYMVLRGYGIRSVVAAGLAPALGLHHRGRSNYFNLVDDLIEPFRPAIDDVVLSCGMATSLQDPETKKRLVAAATRRFTEDGLRVPAVFDDLAQSVGRYVEGEVQLLDVIPWTRPFVEEETESGAEER